MCSRGILTGSRAAKRFSVELLSAFFILALFCFLVNFFSCVCVCKIKNRSLSLYLVFYRHHSTEVPWFDNFSPLLLGGETFFFLAATTISLFLMLLVDVLRMSLDINLTADLEPVYHATWFLVQRGIRCCIFWLQRRVRVETSEIWSEFKMLLFCLQNVFQFIFFLAILFHSCVLSHKRNFYESPNALVVCRIFFQSWHYWT